MRNNSSLGTNNEEVNEIRSYDSRQKASQATTEEKTSVITSAQLQGDSDDSYKVGLDVHSELTVKYNEKLKNDLRSKIIFLVVNRAL